MAPMFNGLYLYVVAAQTDHLLSLLATSRAIYNMKTVLKYAIADEFPMV